MSADKLAQLEADLRALADRKKFHKLAYYAPYPKQMELHNLDKRERMLRAGNQEGKTYSAAAETAMHLTGEYPDWYKGHRFDHAVKTWAAGESAVVVRDRMQSLLCGPFGVDDMLGTGFIPKDKIADKPSLSRGVTDAFDTVMVAHLTGEVSRPGRIGVVSDGVSQLGFKSFEQGRKKFQSDAMDFIWMDEEPDYEIYSECITRTTATQGYLLVTFTPMQGRTPLLTRFMDEKSPDRAEVVMTIYDAKHIKDPAAELAKWPEHERSARAFGVPMMGEGRIFPFSDDLITEDAIINVPEEWTRLWGIDFGTGGSAHPFAGVLTLWDRETDCIHVHAAFKTADMLVSQHCARVKQIAGGVRVAWPHDGNQKERGGSSGEETMTTQKLYRKGGLRMLDTFASYPDKGISTEAGVTEIYNRMKEGKFKVARHLMQSDWGNEFRAYHRKDGLIVKVNDDLLSATRQAIMAKAKGDQSPLGPSLFGGFGVNRGPEFASGVDFDLFS